MGYFGVLWGNFEGTLGLAGWLAGWLPTNGRPMDADSAVRGLRPGAHISRSGRSLWGNYEGATLGYFGATLGLLWGYFGVTLGLLWGYFGATLKALWGYFWLPWGYFGATLGFLWATLGLLWGYFGATLGLL